MVASNMLGCSRFVQLLRCARGKPAKMSLVAPANYRSTSEVIVASTVLGCSRFVQSLRSWFCNIGAYELGVD